MRPPKERETAITMTSEDHTRWQVWTDDPYWIRRLDRIAEGKPSAGGKAYTLRADQVLLRRARPKRNVNVKSIQNLKRGSESPGAIGGFGGSN